MHSLCYTTCTTGRARYRCDSVAPPGFCKRGEVRYGSIWGLEYEVPQKLTHLLQCIGNLYGVIRRSSMTVKAHTYYIIFGRPPIGGGKLPPSGGATAAIGLSLAQRRAATSKNPTTWYTTHAHTVLSWSYRMYILKFQDVERTVFQWYKKNWLLN